MEMGWAPFNGRNGRSYLGDLDVAFLGSYAIGMFVAGEVYPLDSWLPSLGLSWHASESPSAAMALANVCLVSCACLRAGCRLLAATAYTVMLVSSQIPVSHLLGEC